jgi:UDP-glucose 4-epimerase
MSSTWAVARGTVSLKWSRVTKRLSASLSTGAYGPRRSGDVPKLVADPSKANREWGWKTELTLKEMCEDSVNFVMKRMMKKE